MSEGGENVKERMRREIEDLARRGEYRRIPDVIKKYIPELVREARASGDLQVTGTSDSSDWEDIAELQAVLDSIARFIENITEPLKKLLDVLFSTLDGAKLGREVASFYQSLVESGMPADIASQLTKEYFEKRMKIADLASLLQETLGKGLKGMRGFSTFFGSKGPEEGEEDEGEPNSTAQ
jgi:hypothetical protein